MEPSRRLDKSEEFATGKTFGLIVKYSIPTIVGMLVNALYVLIDRVFVGHLKGGVGELGMAGINIAMPLTIIIFAVAMFAGAGAAANISLSLGRGDRDRAERYIGNGLTLGTAVALVVSVVFILLRVPLLRAFGATGNAAAALPYADSYLTVMLIGTTINTFGFCLSRYILAQGFTTVSMTAMFVGVGVNIALAPLFLFVFGWGVAGSAAATVVAQTASTAFSLQFFLRRRMPLSIRLKYLKPDWTIIGQISAIGVSPGLLQLAMAFVQIVLNNSLKAYGGEAISALSVVNAVSQVLLMPIFGINQGVQPIIGFNYGAKLYHRVRKLLVQAILIAVCLMVAFWAVLMLDAPGIVRLFGAENAGLMRLGPAAIRMFLLALPLVGFQVVSANYFQAVGKPTHSLALTMSRQVLFLLPAVLILPIFLGMNGVFWAGAVADTLSTIMTAIFLVVELRRLTGKAMEVTGSTNPSLEKSR
jgi:putative MATE family efflux protein